MVVRVSRASLAMGKVCGFIGCRTSDGVETKLHDVAQVQGRQLIRQLKDLILAARVQI
jgi:hypothetical protein